MYAGDVIVFDYYGGKAWCRRAEEQWVLKVFSSGGVVEVDGVFGEVVAVMMWWQDRCKDSSAAKGR